MKLFGVPDSTLEPDGQVLTTSGGDRVWAAGGGGGPTGPAGGVLDGTYPNPGLAASVAGTGLTETADVLDVDYGTSAGTACQGNDSRLSDSRAPTGSAGGVLDGTYPNPGLAAGVAGAGLAETADVLSVNVDNSTIEINVDTLRVKALGITDAQVAAANKDGTAGTASMRTLGTGAAQACAGNDSRLSDSRAPSGSAGGVLDGTYPNPGLAAAVAGAGLAETSDVLSVNVDGSTIEITTDTLNVKAGGITGTEIAAAIKDPAAATAGLRTLGTGAAQACAGNDSRLSDSRAPNGSAGGDLGGTYPNPTVAQIAAAPSHLTLPVTTSTESTEGRVREDSTVHDVTCYDTQRERVIGVVGWTPYAYPPGYANSDTVSTNITLAANGGSIAIPIEVTGHMLLQSLTIRSGDTATARTAEWRLYRQYLNNGNAGENTLTEVANANGTYSFTPSAASNRTSTPSSPPIYLAPGIYWLVVRNTHATNTFAIAMGPTGTMQNNMMQTKTLGSALGSTLDFVAATWTKVGNSPVAILQGRVFGQTAAF